MLSIFTSLSVIFLSLLAVRDSAIPSSPHLPFEAHLVGSFVQETNQPVHYEIVKPALELAVDEVNRRYLNRIRFKLKVRNDTESCFTNLAGGIVAEAYFTSRADAIFGPACDIALDQVARLASFWKLPVFTAGGWASRFSDKNTYGTLTRLSYSLDQVAHFLLQILKEYDWHHICMIIDETDPSMTIFKKAIESNFLASNEQHGYELFIDYQTLRPKTKEGVNVSVDLQHTLKEASKSCRIMMLMMSDSDLIRELLLAAYDLGYGNGDYAFIALELIKGSKQTSTGDVGWYKLGSRRNKEAKQMYESLLVITVRIPISQEFGIFANKVAKMATSYSRTGKRYSSSDVNPVLAAFYDSVLIYATAINDTISQGRDPNDGKEVISNIWGKKYLDVGLSGDVFFNENGDRQADYTLNDLDPESGLMIPVATYFGSQRRYEKLKGIEIRWPGIKKESPADEPKCGFRGDHPRCAEPSKVPLIVSLVVVFVTIALISSIATYFIQKKLRYESSLSDMWWKINYNELEFQDKKGTSASSARIKSSTSLLLSNASFGTRVSGKSGKSGSQTSGYSTSIVNLDGIDVATWRGIKVAVKEIKLTVKFHVNRDILVSMKHMLDCQMHDNLVKFYGMTIEDPTTFVMELCSRGSLRDIIENDSITIDWLFRYSILTDIVEGMYFLHTTPIEYHGHLKSSNLLVDGRFTVKIGDYGLRTVYQTIKKEDDTNPRILLWTAPEHLRSKDPLHSGSQKGDVYSFAIICQEVITRNGPFEPSLERRSSGDFGVKNLDPDEILDKVRVSTFPPFRPELTADDCIECPDLLSLIRSCWDESPSARPDFGRIKINLRKLTKGVSSKNFLDNLLKRLEQYSNSLEAIVNEKTQTIVEEKIKAEELIHQLLPKFVAEELKMGKHVEPQTFDSVSIFFSDIIGFREASEVSHPHETVELLNDIYSTLDAIIEKYDVFKVETIADAYLVASGVPLRNGNEHAREIGRMALDMRIAMRNFQPNHVIKGVEKLQIRMGIHSGSCVAGVIGLKMPKYCLFGDAINTASRMETNGEPGKIHISSVTKSILDLFGNFIIMPRGEVELKGKGKLKTFWLEGEDRSFT